jgi:hypothetical protein
VQNPGWYQPPSVSERTEEALSRILEDPKFGSRKESRDIQFKQGKERPRRYFNFPSKEIMGKILRALVIAAVLAALGFGLFYAYRRRNRIFAGSSAGKSSIDNPAREECQTLLQQAQELHNKGRIREAWALCFRAFISVFTSMWFIPFPAEATEYESLTLVRKNTAAETGINSFENFIRSWIVFAYGGQEPERGSFEQAVTSCRALLENKNGNQEDGDI